jgi:DNA modification methylase
MTTAKLICGDVLEVLKSMKDNSVDFSFFSPPYPLKTERYVGARKKMDGADWMQWMDDCCAEVARITNGMCGLVMTNPVVNGVMQPFAEQLVGSLYWLRGLETETTCIWRKNSAPNRHQGQKQWFRHSYEQVLFFSKKGVKRTFNWEEIAQPPKFGSGGKFRQRNARGEIREGGDYPKNKFARPCDIFNVPVGGGMMGSRLSSENEAPFPEKLVEPFVKVLSNPGDTVLDPFCGSGTTGAVALRLGRSFIGVDVRPSQIDASKRRLWESGCTSILSEDARNLKQKEFSF